MRFGYINGSCGALHALPCIAFAAGRPSVQSFAASTASGESISRTGTVVPPRRAVRFMIGKMAHRCLLRDERYGCGSAERWRAIQVGCAVEANVDPVEQEAWVEGMDFEAMLAAG